MEFLTTIIGVVTGVFTKMGLKRLFKSKTPPIPNESPAPAPLYPTESFLTEAFHNKVVEKDVRLKEFELMNTHKEEKENLNAEIAELKKTLAKCQKTLQYAQERIASLEANPQNEEK